jgi:hypothetical protein
VKKEKGDSKLAKNKYDKYFISGVAPEIQATRPYATLGFLDGKTFKDCNEYSFFWIGDKPYGAYGTKAWGEISHGPHTHKYPEIFVHMGTDPDNPWDLGAEVEMCMGPEMEKHIITKSVIMCLPAGFVHGPWRILKVTRPFIIVTINQNPTHTEKALRKMIPEKDHNRMIFMDQGYEDEGIQPAFDWPELAGPQGKY